MSTERTTYMTDSGGRDTGGAKEYEYDEVTGTWVESTIPTTPETSTEITEPSETSQVDSKTEAEKEFIDIEINTLTGELSLVSTEKTIRIKVNDTIQLEGVGKYLSGLYFVTAVRRTLNKDSGYTHTISVLKNGFGDSLKKSPQEEETRQEEVTKSSPEIKVGDSVRIVGEDAVYSNAHDGVKVPEWVKKKTHTVDKISEDGTRVRLKEIWSWTYLKYIQKV